MKVNHIIKLVFLMTIFIVPATAQDHSNGGEYIAKTYEKDGRILNYNIMYPHDFDESKKYPLLLFLHGAGERGTDNKAQLVHGSKMFQDSIKKFPAIMIFPQCPRDDYWVKMDSEGEGQARNMKIVTDEGPNPALSLVMELINETLEQPYIDKGRFYVTGLSMGGMGTIELAWRMPDKIAAAIAICGVGPTEKAEEMKSIPFWFVHGTSDNVVPSRYSNRMVEAMQKTGGKAKITLYTGVGHNSWDRAFANPDFLPFLFSKSKN